MANLWNAFRATAKRAPDAPAIVVPDGTTSFDALRSQAEEFSSRLTACGVSRGDVVALQLPKRVATYALLLACLRLGAPYIFIDPKNPAERTARILATVTPKLFVSPDPADANPFGAHLLFTGDAIEWPSADLPAVASRGATGSDPAYIMFTSGSTGEPKGAAIPHHGVLSLMGWARSFVHSGEPERFTAINPLHFDNSVFDTYCGLLNGAALVPVETSELTSPVQWVKRIRGGGATVMFAVPTLFLILDQLGLLTPESLPSVRTFQFGGEGFPIGKLREFHRKFDGKARLINVYGPTETSCICSSVDITEHTLRAPDDAFPPLGAMHENFSYAILDDGETPVKRGDAGELWIGGPCVGLGYYNNPEETRRRFRQDPRQDKYAAIFYRTGDLVSEDETGQLWFKGRADNQVKLRGHRIELEEIDLAVQSVAGVRRALAVVVADGGETELAVAFVADRPVGEEEVRALCRERLPAYMRPARIAQLDTLPMNANGKVDRRAVSALFAQDAMPA